MFWRFLGHTLEEKAMKYLHWLKEVKLFAFKKQIILYGSLNGLSLRFIQIKS